MSHHLDLDIPHARALAEDLAQAAAHARNQSQRLPFPSLPDTPATSAFAHSLSRALAAIDSRSNHLNDETERIAAISHEVINHLIAHDHLGGAHD